MCKYGTRKEVYVIRRANPFVKDGWHKIFVDACLAEEIQKLNDNGIITEQCCCGHDKSPKSIWIAKESKERAEELGYKPIPVDGYDYLEIAKERQGDISSSKE